MKETGGKPRLNPSDAERIVKRVQWAEGGDPSDTDESSVILDTTFDDMDENGHRNFRGPTIPD